MRGGGREKGEESRVMRIEAATWNFMLGSQLHLSPYQRSPSRLLTHPLPLQRMERILAQVKEANEKLGVTGRWQPKRTETCDSLEGGEKEAWVTEEMGGVTGEEGGRGNEGGSRGEEGGVTGEEGGQRGGFLWPCDSAIWALDDAEVASPEQ